MKNKFTTGIRALKHVFLKWSGSDAGRTARRDWYTALTIATLLGCVLIVIDVTQYQNARTIVTNQAETLPVRGLPTNEDKIRGVWNRYESRRGEFETYVSSVPRAPVLENTRPTPAVQPETVLSE